MMIMYPCALCIAELLVRDYENEAWGDTVASPLFECVYLWSGKNKAHFDI